MKQINTNCIFSLKKCITIISVTLLSIIFCSLSLTLINADEPPSQSESINVIIDTIKELENKCDPKCYATASRLEDFIYGTPLSPEARFEKIKLQKHLVLSIWLLISENASSEGKTTISGDYLSPLIKYSLTYTTKTNNDLKISLPHKKNITITNNDKRQYSSIAYALRTILSVQQDILFQNDKNFLPLEKETVEVLKEFLDVFTLTVLNIADSNARLNDKNLITKTAFNESWNEVARSLRIIGPFKGRIIKGNAKLKQTPKKTDFTLIKKIIEQKVASYAVYNKISTPLFLRNLQVYFARHQWPADPKLGNEFKSRFTETMIAYAADCLIGAEQIAKNKKHDMIRIDDVSLFTNKFIPHTINEYEDAIFFPNLPANERLTIESYDMDAFRDSGIHWRYLQHAINGSTYPGVLDIDPFAAELLVENIAQFGVLLLRITGNVAKEENDLRLHFNHIDKAMKIVQQKINLSAVTPSKQTSVDTIKSSNAITVTDKKTQFFYNVTASSGISFEHRSADWLSRQIRSYVVKDKTLVRLAIPPAFGGSGVASEDINQDGYPDILLLSGAGNKLFFNNQKGGFVDVTGKSGINWVREEDGLPGEPRQPIIADFDNDGLQDIFITYVKDNHKLYHNLGNGSFKDVSALSGLGGKNLVGGPATVFDFDRDGLLDLYIGYFGDYPEGIFPTLARRNSNGMPNQLFKNMGGLQFKNVTKGSNTDNTGWTQAISHTDFNLDGWQDIIVGNDFGINAYYQNQRNGSFKNVADVLGTAKPSYTMNIGITDLNRDGYPDFYISNIVTMDKDQKYVLPNEKTTLKFDPKKMANMRVIEANDLFLSQSKDSKFDRYILSDVVARGKSSTGWAWDADFFDFDNDGDDDLYCVNGMNEFKLYSSINPYFTDSNDIKRDVIMPVSEKESNVFFVNEKDKLQNMSKKSGVNYLGNSRSAAYLDYDSDGDLDIILNNYHDSAFLYENKSEQYENNWLKIKLVGDPEQKSNLDAIGAKIIVTTPDKNRIWREIHGTTGYLSVHPKQQHIGLGKQERAEIQIIWPNGEKSSVRNLEANNLYVVSQKELQSN